MIYRLHPEAALEHERQFAYYEEASLGLGMRYHLAVLQAVDKACASPHRFKLVRIPNIRRVALHGFPLVLLFREADGEVQVLAVAHHRRKVDYWQRRV